MPYAFEQTETIGSAVARIMDEQIVRARENLTDETSPIETRVHDARKRFKETRALLRLIRGPLGEQFAVENAWFRDAGRELAASRDAEAVIEALEKLELHASVKTRIRKQLRAAQQQHPPLEPIIANVLEQLVVARARVALWPPLDDSFETIAGGLARTYREGRRGWKRAQTPHELHEWRKRVKEHWYHVQLLRELWPPMMKAYASVMQELSRALGDHHDLHVLRELVSAPSALLAIGTKQVALEMEARAIGGRVYAESTTAWLARMRNVWKAWKT
ncbi:MAG TPA: CHAD domain-containing protein [Thermoanaerobaculia bacterium]|nr:CHAD domain-containing protein [Thermoanaerobaculia bacterium]